MIPLYKPHMPSLPELNDILNSGQLAAGNYTKKFENDLYMFFAEKNVLTVNTFNSAVSIAASCAGCKYGDEIVVSPMACLASTQPYAAAGLKIVWADIDPHTGTLDPESVEKKISRNTTCIIHNHFCGYPGYIDEINEIGKKYGVTVIDDGIECFGATYKGRMIGNCGTDITVFSFNPVRMLTTVDGGAILFNTREMYEQGCLMRDCGIDRNIFRDELGEISLECDITIPGFSATLSNVNAYIGIRQLETIQERLDKQKRLAGKWDNMIKEIGPYKPLISVDGEPNYWVYGILAPDKRECIKNFRDLGYYASGVHINNNRYSVFGEQAALSGVNEFYNSFVALPCGWWMDENHDCIVSAKKGRN